MRDRQVVSAGRLREGPWVLALLLLVASPVAAQGDGRCESSAAREVQRRLSTLLGGLPAGTRVGLVVENPAAGSRWFTHEPQRALKPASVLKLFVTAAALERFGPQFRYETRAYVSGDELWVIGAGDPGLGDERLARRRGQTVLAAFDDWAAALKARGIHSLETIVLDDSIFDRERRHPDWPADQAQAWYQAPVGGLNLNDNCLDAQVRVRDGVADLVLRPPLPGGFVRNELAIGRQHRPHVARALDSDVFVFRGSVARAASFRPISVGRPSVFFGHALKLALQSHGIELRGQVVRRVIPSATLADMQPLATHVTPLPDVLWRCNTYSQNLFAECLLKSLVAYDPDGKRSGQPGSWAGGVRTLRSALIGLGVDPRSAVFRDGSGLSHHNRVTAEQVVQLLAIMWRHQHSGVYLDSLAAGGEGTLWRRLSEPALRDRIRGKSGIIRGVQTLAGYATRSDGTTLSFALLLNGREPDHFQRQVCRILVGTGTQD